MSVQKRKRVQDEEDPEVVRNRDGAQTISPTSPHASGNSGSSSNLPHIVASPANSSDNAQRGIGSDHDADHARFRQDCGSDGVDGEGESSIAGTNLKDHQKDNLICYGMVSFPNLESYELR